MTYTVSTLSRDAAANHIAVNTIGTYDTIDDAIAAAKRAAAISRWRDCTTYGPTSLAYVGREITAVVAW